MNVAFGSVAVIEHIPKAVVWPAGVEGEADLAIGKYYPCKPVHTKITDSAQISNTFKYRKIRGPAIGINGLA